MVRSSNNAAHSALATIDDLAGRGASGALRGYQLIVSPVLGRNCRFEPSCSHFAIEAVRRHGAFRGGWMAVRRLLRCHPWGGPGGFDPVP